ncbi:Reverse transcriptase domain [Trinorchestia longiramus]|nr:Reverse transcriptase domain [Trinorchestia longiramus]
MQDNINSRKPAKRPLLLTIDISKAFDTIPRYLLIKRIYNTELHNNTKRSLANYLSGKQLYVHYSGKSSKTLNIPNGVPQGSVLSPTLFNLYMHDIPQPPENIHIGIIRRQYHDHIHTQLDPATPNICPLCQVSLHDTKHVLLHCQDLAVQRRQHNTHTTTQHTPQHNIHTITQHTPQHNIHTITQLREYPVTVACFLCDAGLPDLTEAGEQ